MLILERNWCCFTTFSSKSIFSGKSQRAPRPKSEVLSILERATPLLILVRTSVTSVDVVKRGEITILVPRRGYNPADVRTRRLMVCP